MGYRIGSFNIRKFSRNSVMAADDGDSKKDLEVLSEIIRENHYDIIAIQEILHKEALKELLEKVSQQYAKENTKKWNNTTEYVSLNKLTSETFGYTTRHWEGRWAKPISKYGSKDGGNIEEGYAFIWNRDRIKLVNNRKGIQFEPRIADFAKSKTLVRPPLIGRFMPINARYEFRLINTHIAFNTPAKLTKHFWYKDDDSVDFRKKEFRHLIEDVYVDYCNQIFDKTRHDRDSLGLVPYTFMLGDYNLNLSDSDGQPSAKLSKDDEYIKTDGLEIITVNKQLTTLKGKTNTQEEESELIIKSDKEYSENDYLANNYDHFSYDIKTLIDHDIADPNVGVIMAFHKYDGKETEEESKYDLYKKKVSDHLPIYLDIDIRSRRNVGMQTRNGGYGYGN